MQPTRHAEEVIDLPHPFGVAPGEVIVHRDDMHALAFQRVQIDGERGDQRLAFAGLHLGDGAAMQHDAAHQLHVEVALAQGPHCRLAHGGEGIGQDVVQRLALGQALAQRLRARLQLAVAERFQRRLAFAHGGDDGLQRADVAVVGGAEYPLG